MTPLPEDACSAVDFDDCCGLCHLIPSATDTEAEFDLETWSPLDLASAEQTMRQYRSLHGRIAHLKDQARQMRQDVDRWESGTCGPLIDRLEHLDLQLQEMARRFRDADPKHNKTLSLPSGRVSTKMVNPKIEVTDEEAVVSFLRSYALETGEKPEDYLAVSVKIKKDRLNKLADICSVGDQLVAAAHGQPIPGVQVVPGDISATVVVSDG